ncbi:MAG: tetratricopeptide repeat protein [Deferribacterota bacterium]|nr:tetratricopeptide repeat protein [Deferribacterota bacterium]
MIEKQKKVEYLILKRINNLLSTGLIEKAEKITKKSIKNKVNNNIIESQLLYYLGEINYQRGLYRGAKRYFNMSLEKNPYNKDTLQEISNLLIEEYEVRGAKKYILRNLKRGTINNEVYRQYAWCKVLLGQNDEALSIYKRLIEKNDLEPKNYIELSLSYLYTGNIDLAKKTILTAYTKFPSDEAVVETFYDLYEIVDNLNINMKDLYFKELRNIRCPVYSYGKALKFMITTMTIRGYFRFEIEAAVKILLLFDEKNIIFRNYKLAALLCEYIISEITGEQKYIMKLITSVNRISRSTVKRWHKKVLSVAESDIERVLDELLDKYTSEFKILLEKDSY